MAKTAVTRAIRVLVLEDFAPDAEIMMNELRRAGFEAQWQRVQTESEFRQGLSEDLDIILADYSLPQFDALSALAVLKERQLEIPFIIITGTISEDAALKCIREGATDYLLKDRLTRLGSAVEHALEQRSLEGEKQRSEIALVESEERFRRFAEHASDLICRIGLQPYPHFEYINPVSERIFGYKPDDLYTNPGLLFGSVEPEDRALLEQILADNVDFGGTFLLRFHSRRGTRIWLECSIVPIRDLSGQLVELEMVGRDATMRIEAENALQQAHDLLEQRVEERTVQLREANQRTTNILESITNAFISMDRDFHMTYVNKTAAEQTHETIENMLGRVIWDVFPAARSTEFERNYRRCLEEKVTLKFEEYYPPLQAWFEVVCYPSPEGLSIFFDDVTNRRQMIDQLRVSEERFRQIAENIHEHLWMVDAQTGEPLYVSPRFEEIYGLPREEVFRDQHVVFELTHPDDKTKVVEALEHSRETFDLEYRIFRANDGQERWLRTRNFPIRDEQGRTIRLAGITEDITEQKRAEEQRERLAAIVNFSQDAIIGETPEGIITSWNIGAELMYGYSAEEAIGHHINLIVPPDKRQELARLFETVMRGEAITQVETVRIRRDEKPISVSLTLSPIKDATGKVFAISAIGRDITEQKEAALALAQLHVQSEHERQRLRSVLDILPVAVFIADSRGDLLESNSAAREIWGGDTPLVNSTDFSLYKGHWPSSDKQLESHEWGLARALASGEISINEEVDIIAFDGTPKTILNSSAPIRDHAGIIRGAVAVCVDITEKKRIMQQLQQLNESLEERVRERMQTIDLLRRVAAIANQSEGVEEALRSTLRMIADEMDWPLGHVYLLDETRHVFHDSGIWQLPDCSGQYNELIRMTRELEFDPIEGFIASIVSSGKPKWIVDIANDSIFRRKSGALHSGLASVLAFPVLIERQVVAVIEFFCEESYEPDKPTLELMENIGTQIGRAMERQRLQHQLTQVVLNEQRRLGVELHDTVGQQLAGLALSSKSLYGHLKEQDSAEAEKAAQILEQLREAVVHVRAIARGLFPVEIDALGLKAALVDLAGQTKIRYNIDCECIFEEEATVSDNDAAIQLYRIAQEAISNAARHSRASRITVTLRSNGQDFEMKVRDNGGGAGKSFDGKRSGIGLFIMRHRARIIGANLEIRSEEGKGVTVLCRRGGEWRHAEREDPDEREISGDDR